MTKLSTSAIYVIIDMDMLVVPYWISRGYERIESIELTSTSNSWRLMPIELTNSSRRLLNLEDAAWTGATSQVSTGRRRPPSLYFYSCGAPGSGGLDPTNPSRAEEARAIPS